MSRGTNSMRPGRGGPIDEGILTDEIRTFIEIAAAARETVLLEGETGTGKGHVARLIHMANARAGRDFVKVNLPSVPEPLFERELFGHVRGAYTGAAERGPGFFERAHRGTLLLDEIGELPVRKRPRDIPRLIEYLLNRIAAEQGRSVPPVDANAMERLTACSWPGNIRDLDHALRAAFINARGGPIELRHLPKSIRVPGALGGGGHVAAAPGASASKNGRYVAPVDPGEEAALVREALQAEHGNRTRAILAVGLVANPVAADNDCACPFDLECNAGNRDWQWLPGGGGRCWNVGCGPFNSACCTMFEHPGG